MSHPAGYSDSDDSDDDGFELFPYNRRPVQERVRTPHEKLIDAVRSNDVEKTRIILDEGADIHSKSCNNSPILEAARCGHFEMIEFLISRGADVNDHREMLGVIMCVCYSHHSDEENLVACLNLLLEKGADPRASDWNGVTSLIAATRRNRLLLCKRLIEFDRNLLEMPDGEGCTPIFHAVQNKNLEMVQFLVDEGAQINVMDRRGRMLWDLASEMGNKEIFDLVAPEDVKLLEAEEPIEEPPLRVSAFRALMLTDVPRRNDRMYGFPKDALTFVKGIGLDAVASLIEKEKLQFAHLLTWSDEDWKQSGIKMNYHLKKLALNVRKYHEQPWGRQCFPRATSVLINGQVDLFQVVRFLLTSIRIAHLSSTSSLFLSRRYDGWTRDELEKLLSANALLENQVKATKRLCVKIREKSSDPPDLIKKTEPVRKYSSMSLLVMSGLVCIVFLKFQFIKVHLKSGVELIQGRLAIN